MSNRYRDSMDRLHFTQEQKQEMVDRLMEAGPVSSVRPLLRFRRFAAVGADFMRRRAPDTSAYCPLFAKQCPTPFGGVGHTRKSGLQAYKKRRDCAYKKRRFGNRRLYVYIRTAFAVPEAAFFLRLFRLASLSSTRNGR